MPVTRTVFRLGPRALARKQLEQELLEQAREYAFRVNQKPRAPRPRRWTPDAIVAAIQADAAERGRPPSWIDWKKAGPGHPAAVTVDEVVGWANAIEAAGFPRPHQNGSKA